jgi:prefoldin subunit 5
MPDTIKSLKLENDYLKKQIDALKKDFMKLEETLSSTLKISEASKVENMGHSSLATNVEVTQSLEFLSGKYDDLNKLHLEAKQEIHRFNSRLDGLSKQVEGVADAIDEIQRYSYQYNVKILGIPETKQDETSFDTTALCVGLFKGMGVDINHEDIDISHRVPSRKVSAHPKPIICKFVRRISKERVMSLRRDACKVNPVDVGLPEDSSLNNVIIFDHLTPKTQSILFEAKKFKDQHNYSFCWTKNSTVYLRKSEHSRPIIVKSLSILDELSQLNRST